MNWARLAAACLLVAGCRDPGSGGALSATGPPGPSAGIDGAAAEAPALRSSLLEERTFSISLPGEPAAQQMALSEIEALEDLAGELSIRIPAASLPLYERSIAYHRKNGRLTRLSEIFLWRGAAQLRLGRVDQAENDFEEALAVAKEDGKLINQAQALNYLGVVKREKRDLGSARKFYVEAAEILSHLASDNYALHLQILRNLAGLSQLENHPERAQIYIADAARLAEKLGDASSRAQIDMDLGFFEELEGEPAKAFDHYWNVSESWEKLPLFDQVVYWHRLALNLSEGGWAEEAMAAQLKALELSRSTQDRRLDVGIWIGLCRLSAIYPELDRKRNEEPYCTAAADAMEDFTDVTSLAGLHYWRARRFIQWGRRASALKSAQEAVKLSESLRDGIAGRNGRARFLLGRARMFGLLADLQMEAHREDPMAGFDLQAMRLSERLKARSLIDLLSMIRNGGQSAAPAEGGGALQDRREELESLQRQRDSEASDAEITRVLAEIDELGGGPVARPESGAASDSLDLEGVQAALDPGTAVLLLLFGESKSYLFIVRNEGKVESHELAKPQDLNAAANAYLELIANPHENLSVELDSRGANIARLLWGEHEERLKDLPERLIFVGDGDLQQFPLQALPRLSPQSGEAEYLIDTHEIVHQPSLALLDPRWRQSLEALGPPTRGAIVFADPIYRNEPPAREGLLPLTPEELRALFGPQSLHLRLGRLRYAKEEAESIRKNFAHRSIVIASGPDASRERALANDIGSFSILHFASHGRIDENYDELSALLLSEVDRNGRPVEGALKLQDLYQLPPLRAELVVASACQTGVGDNLRLEGIGGLAQGFLQAGARRVMLSLWKVDSQTTAFLMDRFYAHLIEGAAPGAALRLAALDLRQEAKRQHKPWGSPFYWAPFILAGDWHSFELSPKLPRS